MATGEFFPNENDLPSAEQLVTEAVLEIIRNKEAEGFVMTSFVEQIPESMFKPDANSTPRELEMKQRRKAFEAAQLQERVKEFQERFGEEHVWTGPILLENRIMPCTIGIYVKTPTGAPGNSNPYGS